MVCAGSALRELLLEIASVKQEGEKVAWDTRYEMEKLPSNLDDLSRHDLSRLSLRINPGWPINTSWSKERMLKRLRCWETDWLLCLSKADLVAMALRVNQWTGTQVWKYKKEVYISVLNAAMTRVFTDVCCSLQYGVVHCVSS